VVEERDGDELRRVAGTRIAPAGVRAFNPAFDVTPAALVGGVVTECGVAHRPYGRSLARMVQVATRRP
jgi:methylthioribose-1-phosphate isomerase